VLRLHPSATQTAHPHLTGAFSEDSLQLKYTLIPEQHPTVPGPYPLNLAQHERPELTLNPSTRVQDAYPPILPDCFSSQWQVFADIHSVRLDLRESDSCDFPTWLGA
jgi:hypothetical protein